MPLNYTDDDLNLGPAANSNVLGVQDVSPEHALVGIDGQDLVPPSAGMRTPTTTAGLIQRNTQQQVIAGSPPVRQWAATADPAHLAVTKDDFPALAKVADYMKGVIGNPFQDVYSAYINSENFVKENQTKFIQHPSFTAAGNIAMGTLGMAGALVAPLNQYIKRAIVLDPTVQLRDQVRGPDGTVAPGPVLTDPADRERRAQDYANLGTFLVLGAGKPNLPEPGVAPNLALPAPSELPPNAPPAGVHPGADTLRAQIADVDAQGVAGIQAQIAETKTHTRSPAVMEQYIAQQTGGRTVEIDPDKLVELAQQGHEPFPEHAQEILQSAQDGEPFTVPLARYLARTSGQPFADDLNSATTFREGGVSVNDAKELPSSTFTTSKIAEDYDLHNFEYTAPNGEKITGVITPPKIAGGPLEIDINGADSELGGTQGANRVGVAGMRDLYRKVTAAYPEAGSITGLRTTGARSEPTVVSQNVRTETAVPSDLTSDEIPRYKNLAAASETELQQIVQEQKLHELFTEAKAVGATKDQFERYNAGIEEAIATARDKILTQAYQQILAERKPGFQALATRHTADRAAELENLPTVQATNQLSKPGYKLDQDLTHNFFPGSASRLPKSVLKKNGNHPDEAAALLGYDSTAQMVADVANLHDEVTASGARGLKEYIKQQAREYGVERARQESGLTHAALSEAAHAAVADQLPQISDYLYDDLKNYAKENNLTPPYTKAQLQTRAAERFAQRAVKEAVSVRKLEEFLRRDNARIETALQKGDFGAAFRWKQAQFLHQNELILAHRFQKVYNSTVKQFAGLAKSVSIKSIAQPYLDAIHGELANYGYKVPQGNLNYAKWVKEQEAEGKPVLPDAEVPIRPINDLSVQDFTALRARIANMVQLGKAEKEVIVAGKRANVDALVQEAIDGAQNVEHKPFPNTPVVGNEPWWLNPQLYDLELSKAQFMFDKLDDGNPNGVFQRVLMNGANDAYSNYVQLDKEVGNVVRDIWDSVPKDQRAQWLDKIEPGHGLLDPRTGKELNLTKHDVLSILLNMGSDTNRWHLFEGGWNFKPDAVQRVIDQNVTAEEAGFVQSLFDMHDNVLWPKIVANERRVSGVAPEKVRPTEFTVGDKSYKGGYFTLVRDPRRSGIKYGTPDEMFNSFTRDAATNAGFTIKRTGAKYPVLLDFQQVLFNHVPKVLRRVAYEEYVQTAHTLLKQPAINRLLEDVHGYHAPQMVENWLKRQVGFQYANPRDLQTMAAWMRRLRKTTYMVGSGLRTSVGLEHASTISQSMSVIGEGATLRGYSAWLAHPVKTTQFAHASSPYLRTRATAIDRDMGDIRTDINAEIAKTPGALRTLAFPLQLLERAGHAVITAINQYTVAVPTWTSAYMDARAGAFNGLDKPRLDPMEHDEAVRYADRATSMAHGTGAEKDLSQFQSGGDETKKLLNMYYNYRGTQLQLNKGGLRRVVKGRTPAERAEGARRTFWNLVVASIVGSVAAGHLPGKKQPIAAWVLDSVLMGMMNGYVGVREVAQGLDNKVHGRPLDFNITPAETMVTSAMQGGEQVARILGLVHGKRGNTLHMTPTGMQKIFEGIGFASGMLFDMPLPTGQLGASVQGLRDIGKRSNKHPIAGVVYGPSHER